MERTCDFGGPEEGGWWVHDSIVVAWKEYSSIEMAEAAKEAVEKLAEELTVDSKRSHGEHCLRTMEWLEERGLEAYYLPEPDGPSEYYVFVCTELPQSSYQSREYS